MKLGPNLWSLGGIPDKVNHYLLYVGYSSVGLERLIVVQEVAGSTPVSHQNTERWQSWSIASDLKSEVLARVPWVRILLSPPSKENRESADGNNHRTSIRHTLLKTPQLTEISDRYGVLT